MEYIFNSYLSFSYATTKHVYMLRLFYIFEVKDQNEPFFFAPASLLNKSFYSKFQTINNFLKHFASDL